MTGIIREWLPAEALSAEVFLDQMRAVVLSWSRVWSAGAPVRLALAGQIRRKPAPPDGVDPRSIGQALQLAWRDADALALAGWALGHRVESAKLTDADRTLLLVFAQEVAKDFARHFEAELGMTREDLAGSTGEEQPRATFEITSPQGAVLLSFSISAEQLVLARKHLLGPRFAPTAGLVPLREALGEQAIDYTVWLGTAELTAGELEQIEVGDVLVLEQPAANPVRLSLMAERDADLRGYLQPSDTHFALRLCE